MNNLISIICLCTWGALTLASVAQPPPSTTSGNHVGTWQLILFKRGDGTEHVEFSKESRRLKMLTPTHFTMVEYVIQTKEIAYLTGGPYSLRDGIYTETIEFANEKMRTYRDKTLTFSLKFIGEDLLV